MGRRKVAGSLTLLPSNFRVYWLLCCFLATCLSHPMSDSPFPVWLPGGTCWWTGMLLVHPPEGLHPNPPGLAREVETHCLTPAIKPMRKHHFPHPHPPVPTPQTIRMPEHAESVQRFEFRQPQAKPTSSLRCSENRVHWKSAKLQYIGISICQLLNSKTDCLKTESVSYSKFTILHCFYTCNTCILFPLVQCQ